MANLPSNNTNYVTVEETQAMNPVSEATAQKQGGAANFMMTSTASYNARLSALEAINVFSHSFTFNNNNDGTQYSVPSGGAIIGAFITPSTGSGGGYFIVGQSASLSGATTVTLGGQSIASSHSSGAYPITVNVLFVIPKAV